MSSDPATPAPTTVGNGAVARQARRRWMGVLAKAPRAALEGLRDALPRRPDHVLVRRPEVGLVMVRGRAGGTGDRFNLGEMTATRCAVRLTDGTMGVSYVAGRDTVKAELAAVLDAVLQGLDEASAEALIGPLESSQRAAREVASRKAAATKVDFFTLVRGED